MTAYAYEGAVPLLRRTEEPVPPNECSMQCDDLDDEEAPLLIDP
jgi:hypothetical protein